MRVLFFGTAEFAVPSLDALVASNRHAVIAVVTQPDRPQGRGQRTDGGLLRVQEQLEHAAPIGTGQQGVGSLVELEVLDLDHGHADAEARFVGRGAAA